ncbi:MAG: hypothetical protein ACYC64_04485 [Armatimonadota bacterium]
MAVTIRIILVAVLVLTAAVNPALAFVQCDFEGGTDWEAVGGDFAGLSFGWSGVGDVYYADINDTLSNWPFKSDNGKENDDWSFFISGDFAGFSQDEAARVNLTYGVGSYFSFDYSSEYALVLKAYSSSGVMLGQETGSANAGVASMSSLSINRSGISYVTIAPDMGNYGFGGVWVMDNIQSDAPSSPNAYVPEWPSVMLGLMGLGGVLKYRRR